AWSFPRKWPPPAEPIANASWTGIVRGRCKPKISKFTTQAMQQLTRLRNRFERIERVFEAAQSCGCRHELRYALCTCAADRVRLEATFLPDQAGEEINRQIVGRCRVGERLANAKCLRWIARVIGRCRWSARVLGRRRWSALLRRVVRLVNFFRLALFGRGLLLDRRLLHRSRIIVNVRCECQRPDRCHGRGQEQSQQEVGRSAEAATR